ncbi:hypothetical protein [Cyanobacterium aponinum]|uniref:Transcriptional regulator n=1 Tax=Cyanobacterium aponinum 0216 TaxID=2676140 RepID=A0A844GVH4_9CHRO|nr:hypothetical protein [Cyanobacterium aponinum]MTF40120.1 hypothetical protein [Cyanobacterium aponinum 0216]
MGKTLSEMMANFTHEEQAEIQEKANQLTAEEITLRELRKAYHLTQMEIVNNLGVGQNSICKS